MRLTTGILAITMLAVGSPAAGLVITETFETLAPKDTPLPFLVSPVGTFTGAAGTPFANVFIASPGYNNFGPGNNPTTSSVLVANGDESFDVALSFAASQVTMDLYLNDLGPATLSFFNGVNLLGALNFPADALPTNNFLPVVFAHATPITRFTFVSTNGGLLNTGVDNVAITVVPEPASWAMLIGGFALAGIALRTRNRRLAAT